MTKNTNLKIKDYSVSKEEFDLIYDEKLDKYATLPVPENLDQYYLSEDYISHTDSKKGLFEKAYHFIKRFMLKKKLQLVSSRVAQGALLDIGAGTGDFLKQAKNEGWKVTGIEPSPDARKKASEKGIALFQNIDAVSTQKFDAITMWHVLEHVPDLQHQIEWLKNHLNKNGVLFVAVPNFNSLDAKHYKNFWAAWDVPRNLHHFSAKSIKSLFEAHGFILEESKPLVFDSFYVSLLSEKYKASSFFQPCSAFLTGLRSNWSARRSGEYSSLIYVLKLSK